MLERDRIIEIVVAACSVFLLLGIMVGIGTIHATDGGLSSEGGELLVAAIVGFILLLTTVGIGLAFALNQPEEGTDPDDADDQFST